MDDSTAGLGLNRRSSTSIQLGTLHSTKEIDQWLSLLSSPLYSILQYTYLGMQCCRVVILVLSRRTYPADGVVTASIFIWSPPSLERANGIDINCQSRFATLWEPEMQYLPELFAFFLDNFWETNNVFKKALINSSFTPIQ